MGLPAQETTATVNNDQPYGVHQIGILRTGDAGETGEKLPLPDFVHTQDAEESGAWIDFSALYLIPPPRTTTHKTVTFKQTSRSGRVEAWYPYGARVTTNSVEWKNLQAGVMADGLETTQPVWMTARGVSGAAAVKLYKDGLAPMQPVEHDNAGTTEGDVYLFMRAAVSATSTPLKVQLDKARSEWVIYPQRDLPASDGTVHAWVVRPQGPDIMNARRIQLAAAAGDLLRTRCSVPQGELETSSPLALRIQLNEALVGNGLLPDEAMALSELALESMKMVGEPVLLYFVPQAWIDANLPLEITGNAGRPHRVFLGIARPGSETGVGRRPR